MQIRNPLEGFGGEINLEIRQKRTPPCGFGRSFLLHLKFSASRVGAGYLSTSFLQCESLHNTHISQQFTMAIADSARVVEAQKLAKTDPRKAEAQFKEIISKPPSVTSDAAVREYETALVSLGELYRDEDRKSVV